MASLRPPDHHHHSLDDLLAMPALTLSPLPASRVPGAPKANMDPDFGRIVTGLDAANLSDEDIEQVKDALYRHSVLVFPDTKLSPEAQYRLTKAFDPTADSYGHGNNKTGCQAKSILHPDLKTIPRQPQVQLIGNGLVKEHEGLTNAQLRHPHHRTFHKTRIPDEEDKAFTRFYRWHIDAALYDLSPPRATTLYAVKVPKGEPQVCRYDDGTGDELPVPLGTTAFVSGRDMFESLSPELKSLAVRTKVVYAPHPYVWMGPAASNSLGLGLVTEGKELKEEELPPIDESKIKTLPMLWKNPVTGGLHLQVHPSAIKELLISPVPSTSPYASTTLYPEGAHLTDLKQVRDLVYSLQRPAIAPAKVYAHDWREGDLCVFHNQGVLHSVVGAFREDEVRMFHQCNLAASEDPKGPSEEDVAKYA